MRTFAQAFVLFAALLGTGASALAAEKEITVRDYTGWGFAPDLVSYVVAEPPAGADKLRLTDAKGDPVPLQVTPGPQAGKVTLSFVAQLPPDAAVTYRLRDDGQGAVAAARVTATPEGECLVLASPQLAVRVPMPAVKLFDAPVPISTLPPPVLGFRNGAGPWLGGAKFLSDRKVKSYSVALAAKGPVYAEVRCEYVFENGGYCRASVQVIDGVPLAKVAEEYDARELSGKDFWELDLGAGWSADMAEAPREGRAVLSIADVIKNRPAPGTPGSAGQVVLGGQPDFSILPSYGWVGNAAFYVGLWSAAEREAKPDGFTRVCFMPLHKGSWRMVTACEFRTDGKQMKVRLPISARWANWHQDGASQTSPFSIGQHDPSLPRTLGRRVWGLVLAPLPPEWRERGAATGGYSIPWNKQPATFWRMRNWYGVVGLDRYKDYILTWEDKHVSYPRVFITPREVEQYRAYVATKPDAWKPRPYWLLTGDAEVAKKNVAECKRWLASWTRNFMDVVTVGHHDWWGYGQALAEDVLAWPALPAEDRQEVRARLALGGYMWTEPDLVSSGIGDHTGNPNMSTSRQQSYSNFTALLPDHPMHEAWKKYMSEFTLYKIAEMMAPGGGWFEFGNAYHVHGFYAFPRGFMGHVSAGSPCVDTEFPYLKADMEYYLNLLTPVDSRYKARMIPGGANSSIGYYERWGEWIGAAALRDPELAATLRWAYEVNGRNDRGGDVSLDLMNRPWIQPKEPKLTSRIFPGVGVVFRAHQGPDETYMYFRSGNNWSHWYVDQGHFLLQSKGATLVPSQPYQYYWPQNKAFDLYNAIRFGHPENEFAYDWSDSSILDHAFGPTVDYAWASAGYPEWYITPGRTPGFGDACKLAEGAAPQGGSFWWNRQVMFVKGKTARSPNYFVFRDTMTGEGKLPSWLSLDLLGRKTDVRQEGGHIAVNTEWPVKLDMVFVQNGPLKLEMAEDDFNVTLGGHWGPAFWRLHEGDTDLSPNWTLKDGSPVKLPLKMYENPGILEKRVLLRLANAPGAEYFWVLYPRDEKEALPPATQLAPGAVKVQTAESTDYVFVAPSHIQYEGEGVVFAGSAGAVRVGKDAVTLALTGGSGRVGYRGYVLEGTAPVERTIPLAGLKKVTEPIKAPRYAVEYKRQLAGAQPLAEGLTKAATGDAAEYVVDSAVPVSAASGEVRVEARKAAIHISPAVVRFVVWDRSYARLTVGTVGVRGVGPFDLTFTDEKITGVVDGDTRTIVVTKPRAVVRPMYHMDGLRYYAGFADDSAPFRGLDTPQFSLAFGVTEGKHRVEVEEWTYPSLPPVPPRRSLD